MKTVLCSTYTINELNPPGSFLKSCHCFETCQSSLIKLQPSFSSRLYLMVSQFVTQASVILWQGEKEKKNRQKEKVKKVFLCSSLPPLKTDVPHRGQIYIQLSFTWVDHLKTLNCTTSSRSVSGTRTRMAQDTENACTSFLSLWNLLCSCSSHWWAQFKTSPAIVIHSLGCVLVLTTYRYTLRVIPLHVAIKHWDSGLTFSGMETSFSSSPWHTVKLY